jgi:hypothetical protein
VDAARDLGPVVDINASFSSGVSRQISVVVAGLTRFETQATVDTQTGAIRGNHLLFAAPRVHPDLVQALAQVAIDRPADFTLRLNSFVIPPGTPLSLQQVSASGTAALRGPMVLTLRDKPPLNVQAAQVHFESPGLGDHVQVEGSATIDDASVTFKQKITNLLNADGKPDPQNALPEGQIAVHNLRAATLVKFAPQQQAIIEQVVGPALSATIDTSVQDAYLSATVQATAAALNARSTVTRRADALHVASAHADVHLTPQLVATLQRDSANPIAISKPATASINVQSFDLPSTGGFAYALPSDPIRATVETQDIVIDKPPSLNEPLGIAGLVAEIALTLRDGGWKAEANGDVELRRPSNDQSIASARYRSEVFKQGESTAVTATIGMTGISVPNFEQMLGQKAREISQWTGDNGDMNVHVEFTGDTKKIVARPLLPNFHGEFTTIIDPQSLTITGETHEMKLARAALEARMNPASQKGAATAPTPTQADASETRVQVLDDVPVSMKLRQIRLPMKEKFDPATASIEAEITGGPMRLVNRSENGEVRTTLNDLRLTVNTSNLAEGVQFVLKSSAEATVPQPPAPDEQPANVRKPARVAAGGSRKAGTLEVSGTIDQLIDEQSQLNLAGAKLRMNAKASDVPTAVADALANLQGMLTAAVGPMMTATLKAQNFSLDSGRLEGRIETTNGHLESTILGRQHSLRINTENPLAAKLEITPPLRDRLLYKIHPIFADIRTTEQPLTATINWAQAGFKEDGTFDIADLNANIEITIGKVALDSGSTTLFLLKLFGQAEKRTTIPGEFEPIVAKIRKGIVNYDRFAVRIDKYTMVYSGQINLVNQTMNLRTELPLAALGQSIRELEPYADKIIVPIVTRGKFGEQKTQIDPDFDVGKEALKAGFGGTIENLLRDKGGLGGLFDQLNRDRK